MDEYPLEDLVAWQIAVDLKDRISALLTSTPAGRNFEFRGQIYEAAESMASNISEGHGRYNPAEYVNFLRYSRASIKELIERLPDGVRRGFYRTEDIAEIMHLLQREARIVGGLRDSMRRLARQRKERKRRVNARRPARQPPRRNRGT